MVSVPAALCDRIAIGCYLVFGRDTIRGLVGLATDALYRRNILCALRHSPSYNSWMVEPGYRVRPLHSQTSNQLGNDICNSAYLHVLLGATLAASGQTLDQAEK